MKPTARVSTAADRASQRAGVAGPAEVRRLENLVEEFVGEAFGLAPGEASSNACPSSCSTPSNISLRGQPLPPGAGRVFGGQPSHAGEIPDHE
jgi:hypothetical protein